MYLETDAFKMLFLSLKELSASLDRSAKGGETPGKVLVAAIDVVGTTYLGDAVRSQRRQYEGRAGPDIG